MGLLSHLFPKSNPGHRVVQWLYKDQLQVDAKWSVPTPHGFKWWAFDRPQVVETIGELKGPDGMQGYLVSVRTPVATGVKMSPIVGTVLNTTAMKYSTLAGPVHDERTGDLSLCSLVIVHDQNEPALQRWLGMASLLQLDAAGLLGPVFEEAGAGTNATSGHPESGHRESPDDLLNAFDQMIAPMGKMPSHWTEKEFQESAQQMQESPSVLTTCDSQGLTAEFPHGRSTSLFRASATDPHPRYGNGLLVWQMFGLHGFDPDLGAELALNMNRKALQAQPHGYGIGSFSWQQDCLCFSSFFSNCIYQPGFLPLLYIAAACRAHEVAMTCPHE